MTKVLYKLSEILKSKEIVRPPLGPCGTAPHLLHAHSLSSLLHALVSHVSVDEAFGIFALACRDNRISVDDVTVATIIPGACTTHQLRMLHAVVAKMGFSANSRLADAVLYQYGSVGEVGEAERWFKELERRNVVSWNVLMAGMVGNGRLRDAVKVFDEMVSRGVRLSQASVVTVLNCCARLGCGETARRVCEVIERSGWVLGHGGDVVVGTALVDMHARCGELERARRVFDGIRGKNVVCWSAMIGGYERAGGFDEAVALFRCLLAGGNVKPNAVTMVSIVGACAGLGASRPCCVIQSFSFVTGLVNDVRVLSAMIDMYAKCGSIDLARKLFVEVDDMEKSVILWTAMIGAEGMHGEGRRAVLLFTEMQEQGLKPNEVTFISLLSACNHAGLVEEGMSFFRSMENKYGVVPNAKHYACVVDLLGRAGKLDKAHDIILKMPMEADLAVWGSLLGACHIHGNCKIGTLAEEKILNLDPLDSGHRVLLANMYSSAGRWDDVIRMRVELRRKHLKKEPGYSFIEVGNEIYRFVSEDRSHHDTEIIYQELRDLNLKVTLAGYTKQVPPNVSIDDSKGVALEHISWLSRSDYHSERLAIAFAIMMSRRQGGRCAKEPIHITKNLRVCRDCHVYTKFVSKVTKRELIVRDSRRFHHFKDGFCSCDDYW